MNVTEIGTKKSRKHCGNSGCCQRDSVEYERHDRVLTEKRITENNITNENRCVNGLLEQILEPSNLNKAYKRVKKNKGSHGVDGMEVQSGMKLRVHKKSVAKMKDRVRKITSRSKGISYEALKLKLKQFVRGWVNYFKLADMKKILQRTDEWLRRRLRMFIWKRWKKVKTKYKILKRLGYSHSNAIKYANTRKGYWHVAGRSGELIKFPDLPISKGDDCLQF